MPKATEPAGQFRIPLPFRVQPGITNVFEVPYYVGGSLVEPSAATLTVWDASNTKILDGVSMTAVSSVMTYSYAAPSTLTYTQQGRAQAIVTISGTDYQVDAQVMIVRRRLYCPISDIDLFRVAPALDPNGSSPITSDTDYATYLTEAWTAIEQELIDRGRRPDLVCEPSALRVIALHETLGRIFRAQSHRLNAAYVDEAVHHEAKAAAAWDRVKLVYDETNSGSADEGRRSAGSASIWLC